MRREKLFVEKESKKIAVLLELAETQKGLAVIMHGLGVTKEQVQLEEIAKVFLENEYSVIRFDCVNSIGKSLGGNYEDATVSNYIEDLEDVIEWAKTQDFYELPVLVGQSLGGMCVSLYAMANKIKALATVNSVVSGELTASKLSPKQLMDWKEKGYRERQSTTIPGLVRRLKWGHMEDKLKYSLLVNTEKINVPTLIVVGAKDANTPPTHSLLYYWKLICPKEFHIIPGAGHDFEGKPVIELKVLFNDWIKRINL